MWSGKLLFFPPEDLMCYFREFSEEVGWPLIRDITKDVSSCSGTHIQEAGEELVCALKNSGL